MTALVLLPIAVGLFTAGALVTGPAWRAVGFRAGQRDCEETARLLAGVQHPPAVGQLQPGRYNGVHRAASWWRTFREQPNGRSLRCPAVLARVREEARLRELARRERALLTPTQEMRQVFNAMVNAEWDTGERARLSAWKCDSCRIGRDREPRHASCPGCSCPCAEQVLMIGQPGMAVVR